MDKNDIFRRIRYIFNFSDDQIIMIFGLADLVVSRAQISDWLKRDDDPAFRIMEDKMLATFLNGLITHKRGAKEGPKPIAEKRLNNNIVYHCWSGMSARSDIPYNTKRCIFIES